MTAPPATSTSVPPLAPTEGFAAQLRRVTAAAHERAEATTFVTDLIAGALPLGAYTDLLGQLWHVYAALERVGDGLRDDPVAGPFVVEELRRAPALERDLADLLGERWAAHTAPMPATVRYVARLHDVAAWPAGFVAHHYTRYLGDLAGGQVIRAAVRRHHGLEGDRGTSFHVFDRIARPKIFRDAYRDRLDAVPWDADERGRAAAEAVDAFEHNTRLFVELGERHPVRGGATVPAERGLEVPEVTA